MKIQELFQTWGLTNIKLNIGFAEVEFRPTDSDQSAAWDMYVELLTRVTTQPLKNGVGDMETALTSIFSLFGITREILKTKGRYAVTFTKIAVIVLNQVIRPFTSKWHGQITSGTLINDNQYTAFKEELKSLQNELACYSRLLADMAGVEDLTEAN